MHDAQAMEYEPLEAPTPQQVREKRAEYALTAAKAAELVHVTPNAWFKWEGGSRPMDVSRWELFLFKIGERRAGGKDDG